MNTRTLWKRLWRGRHETVWGDRIFVDIRFPAPASLFPTLPPPFPKTPSDLIAGLWWGYYPGIETAKKEGAYSRVVQIKKCVGRLCETEGNEALVPGTIGLDEGVDEGGYQQYGWYEVTETKLVGEKYVETPYPVAPWVLEEIAFRSWVDKAQEERDHPVLARIQELHRLASKKTLYVDLRGGVHFAFHSKAYERDRMMHFCRAVSRAVRFTKKLGIPIQVRA